MQAQVEDLGGIKRRVTLTVDRNAVSTETDRVLEQAQKEVTVKGFRKGTAPKHLVRTQLGDFINAEVTSRLTYHAISKFVRDFNGGKVAGLPVVIEEDRPTIAHRYVGELSLDGTFVVRADFELEPTLEVKDYKGLEIHTPKPDLQVWINKTLLGIQEQFATLSASTEPAKDGDQLTIELDSDGEIRTVTLTTTSEAPVDGLDHKTHMALLGKNAGDKFSVDGVPVGTVHSVDVRTLPELDATLAHLAGFEGLEHLHNELSLRAEAEYANPQKAKIIEELTTQLIASNDFEVPQAWIDNEVRVIMQRFNVKEMPSLDSEKAALFELAERSVRRSFILDRIYVAEESIHLSTDELYSLAQAEAQRNNLDVEAYLTLLKNNQRYEAFVSFHEQVRAVDFLINSAVVKEQ